MLQHNNKPPLSLNANTSGMTLVTELELHVIDRKLKYIPSTHHISKTTLHTHHLNTLKIIQFNISNVTFHIAIVIAIAIVIVITINILHLLSAA
jgi:hypothetical protein